MHDGPTALANTDYKSSKQVHNRILTHVAGFVNKIKTRPIKGIDQEARVDGKFTAAKQIHFLDI